MNVSANTPAALCNSGGLITERLGVCYPVGAWVPVAALVAAVVVVPLSPAVVLPALGSFPVVLRPVFDNGPPGPCVSRTPRRT